MSHCPLLMARYVVAFIPGGSLYCQVEHHVQFFIFFIFLKIYFLHEVKSKNGNQK